jgi:hypothetical protein
MVNDDDPLEEGEVDQPLDEALAMHELACERAAALGRPVIVAGFSRTRRAAVYDLHGLALDELRPVEVARDVAQGTGSEDDEAPR